jgi:hypothetical protein
MFCNGSEEKLAGNVRQLLADPALRAQFAAAGTAHARSQHSLNNVLALADLLETREAA